MTNLFYVDSDSHKMAKLDSSKLKNPIEKRFATIGRYHYYFFFILFLSKVPVFWHVLNILFLGPPMQYTCSSSGSNSSNVCPCKEVVWDLSVFTKTVQTKFNLYCEQKWLISFSESMIFVGSLFGSLVFGFLSDRFGRLSIFSLCCLVMAIFGCLVSVMTTIAGYITMRIIEGFGLGGAIVAGYVLLVEYCNTSYRETVTALYHIPINVGHMTIAGVSYLLRDCDDFQMVVSIPMFIFAAIYFVTYESPKWLMDNGKIDKAVLVMDKVLRWDGETNESIKTELETYQTSQAKASQHRIKFWEIFKHKSLSIYLACMSYIYFVCGMGYYGVSQYIGKMSGNIHLNVAISGALLLPGTIAAVFLLKILNRRPFLMATNFMSGLLMLIVVCVPADLHFVRVVIACVCNCFFFMSFIIVFLFGVELFPTSIRNSTLGVLSVLSRLGQILAPPLNSLPEYASGGIFCAAAFIAAVLCLPLPETKNAELPSSLEESQTLPHKRLSLTV